MTISKEHTPPEKPRPSSKVLELLTTPLNDDDLFLDASETVEAGKVGGSGPAVGRQSLFEDTDDIEEFDDDSDWDDKITDGNGSKAFNLLGYKVKARTKLSSRRGMLRSGQVMIYPAETAGTARAIADNALISLADAEDRRLLTLRALASLVEELCRNAEGSDELDEDRETKIREAYETAARQVMDKLKGPTGDVYLSVFEELNPQVTQTTTGSSDDYNINTVINNAMLLWSASRRLTNEAQALLPVEYCLPLGDSEFAKCRVAGFFALRRLYRSVDSSEDLGPSDDLVRKLAGESHSPACAELNVCLTCMLMVTGLSMKISVGPLGQEGRSMDMSNVDYMPCTTPADWKTASVPSPPRPSMDTGSGRSNAVSLAPGQASIPLYFVMHREALLVTVPDR